MDEIRVVSHAHGTLIVDQVGAWDPDEVKWVPADMAERLCRRGDFAVAPDVDVEDAPDDPPAEPPAPPARGYRRPPASMVVAATTAVTVLDEPSAS